PAERGNSYGGGVTEPPAVMGEPRIGIAAGQSPRQPTGCQSVGVIGASADLDQAVVLSGRHNGTVHRFVIFPRAPDFYTGLPRHSVPQHADRLARNRHGGHVEEFQLGWFCTAGLSQHFHGAGTLELIPVQFGGTFADCRAVVPADLDVVVPSRSVIVHPIDGRWNANRAVLIVVQMEENVVSDD